MQVFFSRVHLTSSPSRVVLETISLRQRPPWQRHGQADAGMPDPDAQHAALDTSAAAAFCVQRKGSMFTVSGLAALLLIWVKTMANSSVASSC